MHYFFLKIRKDVTIFAICCSPDWRRFNGEVADIVSIVIYLMSVYYRNLMCFNR